MPEGPEVHIIRDQLNELLVGKYILEIYVSTNSKYRNEYPKYSKTKLYILDIECKGKQLFIKCSQLNSIVYINIRLGMEGKILLEKGDHSDICFCIGSIAKTLRIHRLKIYFDDSRHFGSIEFLDINKYKNKIESIGPDLLTDDIDIVEWHNSVTKKTRKNMQICKFLMEQKYFSGIGNYLKAEILYASKIRPDRSLSSLSDLDIKNILLNATRLIKESYLSNGLTIRSYVDMNNNPGIFIYKVYNNTKDPFGNIIVKQTFKDNRTTHWVPNIQV